MLGRYQARCGYRPRTPLLVISPFAKENFVDHNRMDLTSILRFIEDNWDLRALRRATEPSCNRH